MKNIRTQISALIIALSMIPAPLMSQDKPTVEEVIEKVEAAAKFLSQAGKAGLAEFNDPHGRWVWKDTYIFVFNCNADKVAAHPNNYLIGYPLSDLIDKEGNYLALGLCAAADNPDGGWSEYWWPKSGSTVPERKISYMVEVPGQPYELGAGIYEPEMTLEELNALLKQICGL